MHTEQRFYIDEDIDVLERFRDDFESNVLEAEDLSLELETNPDNLESLHRLQMLMKELYSYAFNANIIPLIEPLATLDDFLSHLTIPYNVSLTHPLTLLLDRFMLVANEAAEQSSISYQMILDIQHAIQPLARIKDTGNIDYAIEAVIGHLLGGYENKKISSNDNIDLFTDVDLFSDVELFEDTEVVENKPDTQVVPEEKEAPQEIDFIQLEMAILKNTSVQRMLAETIDNRHKFWVGRSYFLLSMAIKLNAEAGNVVDPEDLANGIFLHDFPMVKLSDEILYGKDISSKDFNKLKEHTELARDLALSLNCTQEVATMIYQHHERPDGKGYPEGLTGDQISEGAKIIAICDAYYAMTNYKANRKVKRSALRTVAEINACSGTQFDERWVKVFNTVVKKYNMLSNI